MADHVEGLARLEEDFVHHRDAGGGFTPCVAAVVRQKDADLVAGLVVAKIGFRAGQLVGARAAEINGRDETAVEAFQQGGRIEVDVRGIRGAVDGFLVGDHGLALAE